ncbi:hypothetical protein P8891_11615 [Bacillus atrophaeus]|uniref:hypothetical protein n=1 Tax=Bacillus atrophaeus TaxID=1452 RepID=UPI00228261FC|nr:hypothetical protein [Bacillus atrophaeus]MCY7947657.1 hypothetical protein [Bacillus atrophaeus]MCY8098453.1 hypothetical protein [Bacillus atrophaeus]MCY9167771.1 hypothetical protein [Bacillus atrophaeus]MEC0741709.1 hypothetical protein [Bacillus atrophaeus]MEC0744976.1 hypothetical protein [Bacillus atrophaeus]
MPLLDYFYVLQFENKEYFKSFKLDGIGYITSDNLHEASKFYTMAEVLEIANELYLSFDAISGVRKIEVVKR